VRLHRILVLTSLLTALVLVLITTVHAQEASPVVHAVLFYSRECGHCQYVITEVLPPLMEHYGEQLQIIGVDVNQPHGQTLFLSALQKFNIDGGGVPFLVVGNTYLIGSHDIPEQFPGLIDTYLSTGGMDWPDVPGLQETLASATMTSAAEAPGQPTESQANPAPGGAAASAPPRSATPRLVPIDSPTTGWPARFAADVAGNSAAVVVLLGMVGSIAWAAARFRNEIHSSHKENETWKVPFLCAVGVGVAGYLAYVEVAHAPAVCGPVGDCNTVQASDYARLFGVLPIGVLGLFGYLSVGVAWLVARSTHGPPQSLARVALLVVPALGTLFSIYLTFLEPFVIGATCAWCLFSSLLMTALMLLGVQPGRIGLSRPPLSILLGRGSAGRSRNPRTR